MYTQKSVIAMVSTIRTQANQILLDQLRVRGIEDVLPAHGAIFVALFNDAEMTMGNLAQAIKRDKSTATVLVNKLERLGYVEKRKDEADNRVTLIRLTPKGLALDSVFKEIGEHLIAKVYNGFTELEKEILFSLLNRIMRNL